MRDLKKKSEKIYQTTLYFSIKAFLMKKSMKNKKKCRRVFMKKTYFETFYISKTFNEKKFTKNIFG